MPRAFFVILLTTYCLLPTVSYAQSVADLQAKILLYEKQLTALGTEKVTLQSTINILTLSQKKLTTQIQITQANIVSANLQIQKLVHSIGDQESSIVTDQVALAKMIRRLAEGEQESLVTQLVSADTLSEAWQVADHALQFNRALDRDITHLQTVRTALATNKDRVSAKKAGLASLKADLIKQKSDMDAKKSAQQELLIQTKNQESNFQKMLAVAKAELASFSAFTKNAGGSKLLANQTSCDAWGCYYSQRDALWGNIPLNRTQYRLASDGCLVTAMAMILTHYGYGEVTPATINADPNNFASYYPAYLLFTIRVDGVTATRIATTIDTILSTGHPVVVGVRAYGGTHFVVLTSGSRGDYLMRDPYIANGKDISFSAHYTLNSIFGVSKVVIKN